MSANSAHGATHPREQIPDITASGVNNITSHIEHEALPTIKTLAAAQSKKKLSQVLPPLVFGTATFNYQFNLDPYALHPNHIVHAALSHGIRAFDTSPYYGPAEEILGAALRSDLVTSDPTLKNLKRSDYFILTKAGRITADTFDYSPAWIEHSIKRSLHRFQTTYLDVVYLHDVEFVSPAEVLQGIRALRSIRDRTATIKYIGICGYPVATLCELAELVLRETGEPLDIVQSYANFTVQNQRLFSTGLTRLLDACVDVVPNASPLGMGLCRAAGVPIGAMGNWHPAPDGLRAKCLEAAEFVESRHGEKLETVAVRFAMERWLEVASTVGSQGPLPTEVGANTNDATPLPTTITTGDVATTPANDRSRLGVNVMGVSKLSELSDTMTVYNAILAARSSADTDHRRQLINEIVQTIRQDILGAEWTDYAWDSPDPGFVNARKEFGVSAAERAEFDSSPVTGGGGVGAIEVDILEKTPSRVEVEVAEVHV